MNNEEKILELLGKLSADVGELKGIAVEQSHTLAEHSRILKEHSQILKEHSQILNKHSQILEDHGHTLAAHGRTLTEHGHALAGMQDELKDVRDMVTKVSVTQEGLVLPRLDLLAEGHTHLSETLAGKSRVEKLEEEVDFMKSVIKALSKEVAELKKAQ